MWSVNKTTRHLKGCLGISHSLVRHNPVRATGLEVSNDLPSAVDLHAAKDVLRPSRTKSASTTQHPSQDLDLPSNPPKIRRSPRIAQMHPTTHPGPARTALATRTASAAARSPLVSRLYKVEPAWRGKRLCLALQFRVVGGMFREDVVEDGEEARVTLERAGRGRDGGGGADCEGRVGRGGVEVGEEVAGGGLGVDEDFLGEVRRFAGIWGGGCDGWRWELTMLGLEGSVDKPRERCRSCDRANRRVLNILGRL
jgi:hypothetical protein